MKYVIFFMALVAGVPVMFLCAMMHPAIPGLLLSLLLFSTSWGVSAGLRFVSMETYRGPDRGFEITVTDLIAIALVLWLVFTQFRKIKWIPPNSLWCLLFVSLACVSTAMAPMPIYSEFTLLKLMRAYLIFWCVFNCILAGVDRRYVWLGFMGVAVYVTLLAIKQKYLFGMYRINGPFDHSNTVPMYLNMILPLLMVWGLCDFKMGKIAAFASVGAALGMIFSVLSTQSRFGLVLSGGCLIGAIGYANWRHRGRRTTVITSLILVGIFAGGAMAAGTVINRFMTAPEASELAREEFNVAAHMMMIDHFFGVGLNNFTEVLSSESRYREHIVVMKNEEKAGVAHHIYLLTGAEMGRIGLAVYLIVIFRFMWMGIRGFLAGRSVENGLIFGLLLGAVALHLVGLKEWALRITPPTYMFAITSALMAAWSVRARETRKKQCPELHLSESAGDAQVINSA
jgi:hypothetical protein